ncbi:unnamed protein product, partial [Prorocentrum cordatum]
VPSSGHAWRCGAAALHERPSLQRRPLAPSAALSLELHRGPRSPGPPPGAHREHRLPRRAGRRPLHDAGAGGGARVPALHAGPRCQVHVLVIFLAGRPRPRRRRAPVRAPVAPRWPWWGHPGLVLLAGARGRGAG